MFPISDTFPLNVQAFVYKYKFYMKNVDSLCVCCYDIENNKIDIVASSWAPHLGVTSPSNTLSPNNHYT